LKKENTLKKRSNFIYHAFLIRERSKNPSLKTYNS